MKVFLYFHFGALFLMSLYGLYRLKLIYLWKAERDSAKRQVIKTPSLKRYAPVTIQLPIYNERFVAQRLINSVCRLSWPKTHLEIQVLDDSDDDTKFIVDSEVKKWRKMGFNINVIRRKTRTGYKAGALAHGLERATGDFIAIFDADFVPPRDFLKRTMPHFQDNRVGLVQARWGFLNEDTSWFTKIQAVFLSAHFGIEQFIRFRRGWFINFNGTAGIWRKEVIVSAGGWQADTVTEDLDLSFRAQLKGWKAVYLDDLEVPSELPVTLTALRSQQKRWAKGSIQTARKILPFLWASKATLSQKIEGTIHLTSNLGWLMGAIIFLSLYPTLIHRVDIGPSQILRIDLPFFILATGATLYYFCFHERYGRGKRYRDMAKLFIFLPAFGLGLAPTVAIGVLEGLMRYGGEFVRTPKYGITASKMSWKRLLNYHQGSWFNLAVDFGFFIYSFFPIVFAIKKGTYLALPFLGVFCLGTILMLYRDLFDLLSRPSPPSTKSITELSSKTQ
ncbi:Glycosyltransferase [Dissulfuribacter thermophilus]|uniref:Glycosyltransferase n=1 Tax=Dissulfuribacter thermophilus TaxID=1156395 RepID=A0A1B9F3T3_9BACT|nr:glycosyltransferase [Dissulfuribacter thermophilus]OCC14599.1 Glycosyltransferase [Dissulfuribacter thermophilus]